MHICAAAPAIRCLFTKVIQSLRGCGRGRNRKPGIWGVKPSGRQGLSANIDSPTSGSFAQLRHTEDITRKTGSSDIFSCEWNKCEEPYVATAQNVGDETLTIRATLIDEEHQKDLALKPLPRPPSCHMSTSSCYSERVSRDMDIDGDAVIVMNLAEENAGRVCSLGYCSCAQGEGCAQHGRSFLDV